MSTTAPTRPTLLSIEPSDKPIRFRQLGMGRQGIVSTIRPGDTEAIQRAIDMVNTSGGPNHWQIAEAKWCERGIGHNASCGKPAVDYLDYTVVCAEHAALYTWAEANQ